MSLYPPLITVVDHLDAPWKIITDEHDCHSLLVRQGTPISEHLVNMINDLNEERRRRDRVHRRFRVDHARDWLVPQSRAETGQNHRWGSEETFAVCSRGACGKACYSIRTRGLSA